MIQERKLQPILNALLVFDAAAAEGSFTKAAARLGMAQPSVSRFVGILEQHLGISLFDRDRNQVKLTPAGRRLREATALGFNHLRSVLTEISDQKEEKALAIGCTHGFAHMWIMPRLADLQERLGDRALRVTTTTPFQEFGQDEIDFEVRFGDGVWPDKSAIPLFDEEVFPVCSPAFLRGLEETAADPKKMTELPLLYQDSGEWGHLSWEDWLAAQEVAFTPRKNTHYIQNYALVLQAAMEGQGVALAWRHLVEAYLRNDWLVRLGKRSVRTGMGYYLLHDPDHPLADIVAKWVRETE